MIQLYEVEYEEWKHDFSGLYTRTALSYGKTKEEAIQNLLNNGVGTDGRNHKAFLIDSVLNMRVYLKERE